MRWRIVAVDFDGTLVDSYSCLPRVWNRVGRAAGLSGDVLRKFVRIALELEEEGETTGRYSKMEVITEALRSVGLAPDSGYLLDVYWTARIEGTKLLPCAREFLLEARRAGLIVASVSYDDGMPNLKRKRISSAGLYHLFDEIIVAGEDVLTKADALALLSERYEVPKSEVVLIDDKPPHIREAVEAGFQAVLVRFRGPFRRPWSGSCSPSLEVTSLCDLLNILRRMKWDIVKGVGNAKDRRLAWSR